ncbi:MAG: histidinol dehydrogenase [Bacteroidales bacterium]|nr:histidinol dehydrogenase [Bacteroidales bacterium]
MEIILNPERSLWKELCKRAETDDSVIEARVRAILERVRTGGDAALADITKEVEGRQVASFAVSAEEIAAASLQVSDAVKVAIARAAANIRAFHSAQKSAQVEVETLPGVRCVRRSLPIERVGLYIPGGSAPLFSTLLMLAIPAKIAGCREIVLCTPAGRDGKVAPAVLYAASVCGVDTIYSLGGAQAIAAMAFGTETIAPVSKIFGPGNRYVTKAKQLVTALGVAIDMPAGPSEVMVIADESANVGFVASDLLSQAEHGPDSQAILVCQDEKFASAVAAEVERQLALLPRCEIAVKALENSRIIVVDGRETAIDFANAYASEHLIISMREPWKVAEKITAAGSVFIGNYSPESAGDYASGTNHTLPTMGLARAWSGIGLDSFMHSITYQELTREGLESLGETITTMAEAEGLDAHAAAVKYRLGK